MRRLLLASLMMLAATPVTIQISNGPEDHILIAVTPWVWDKK